jgi:hypothetical protein
MRKDRFTDEALANARALANVKSQDAESFAEAYDFARCQRSDGSFYPIPDGKKCRKGTEASPTTASAKATGVRSKAKIDREILDVIARSKGAKGLEANRLRQQLAALKAERREPGKTKVANSAPKKPAIKTDFRKDIEAGAKIRRERDAAIEKLQGRQMRLRKAYAKANQDAAAAIRAKDPAKAEKAKARVEKLGEALDSANDMMRKYTGNRGNTGGRTPSKVETEAKTPKRRPEEDVRRPGGKMIGTSPRNMALDNLRDVKQEAADYKKKFSSRSGEEGIKKALKAYEDRIAAAEKFVKEKYGDS